MSNCHTMECVKTHIQSIGIHTYAGGVKTQPVVRKTVALVLVRLCGLHGRQWNGTIHDTQNWWIYQTIWSQPLTLIVLCLLGSHISVVVGSCLQQVSTTIVQSCQGTEFSWKLLYKVQMYLERSWEQASPDFEHSWSYTIPHNMKDGSTSLATWKLQNLKGYKYTMAASTARINW